MQTYDFDECIARRGTASYKWDSANNDNVLPMWVADMDFRTAPPIIEALQRRVAHGIFGYTRVPATYYDTVIGWMKRRHGWTVRREDIIYTTGVVPALSAIIKATTAPGDKVLVQTPVYNCFFSSIRNNGCILAENRLRFDGQTYHIDFDDLEAKAADPQVKLMILCNPHNPAGRVWTREELTRVGEICLRHGVLVLSDEIHCDLVYPGHKHIPFASLSEEFAQHSATCMSPSKSFNLAGLQIANIFAANAALRKRIDRAININEVCDVNPFGVVGLTAAYNEGEDWLEQLLQYIRKNYLEMKGFCSVHLPEFPIAELEGTYLAWMDCTALHMKSDQLEETLKTEVGLWLNSGRMYGEAGEGFMRWNLACPSQRMMDGLQRFERFVRKRMPAR
ncbi:MAG TPA: pyridoxal phosphate-dependent aminotransferase [Candidatus Caccomonas pullistercoris]|nr:pyridoxal phosphate-dependent aminotransferase [Candidatus Caccomonas pullistercoris]